MNIKKDNMADKMAKTQEERSMYRVSKNSYGRSIRKMDTIYIGYDDREIDAVNVLINSIFQSSSFIFSSNQS